MTAANPIVPAVVPIVPAVVPIDPSVVPNVPAAVPARSTVVYDEPVVYEGPCWGRHAVTPPDGKHYHYMSVTGNHQGFNTDSDIQDSDVERGSSRFLDSDYDSNYEPVESPAKPVGSS